MKNRLFILFTALLFTSAVSAQQKRTTEYMTVTTLFNTFDRDHIIYIVTREDHTQEQDTIINKDLLKSVKVYEDIQLQILKTYFDNGWKLVTSTADAYAPPMRTFSGTYTRARYFLSKEL